MFGKWESTTKKCNYGSKINIAHTKLDGGLSKEEIGRAGDAVEKSRNILITAVTLTGGAWTPEMNAAAAKCFLTGSAGPSEAQKKEICRVLTMTKTGACGSTTIKVGSSADANGYVNLHKDMMHKVFMSSKVKSLQSGKTEYVGRAHVDRAYITNDTAENRKRAILTFIHESTHRYAGTVDYDDQGYISATTYLAGNGIRFREPGLDTEKALTNADSYAVFAMEIAG
jgi:hypothetical protein